MLSVPYEEQMDSWKEKYLDGSEDANDTSFTL
jgi:hypothetical protein